MPTFTSAISIAASPERIWSVLADVVHWAEWLPTVTAVELLDQAELRIGVRYRLLQPRLRPAIWTVTEIEPLRKFTWESRSPGVRAVADHVIEPVSDERARVVLSVRFSGLLGGLAGLLAGRLTRDYVAQESAALKRRVEASHP